ncbi:UDP-N-acetylmuramate--L-alanine ligase [Rubritalea marina]|uniref:UDP-N-acetylmuramate--L-alanine ligase n=1 Tax=Rubritalea marina TaxID=361055 RepID=UPI00039B76DB|nr:UDP-N-acetylmuramate--L-alanine ligase [Rubritalea marina]
MTEFSKRLMQRNTPARVHLIGVAGSGMSGLATLLLEMGHAVSGCDRVTSSETERLQRAGLQFSSPHNALSVQDAEVVVYSSAIRSENVALAAARELGIPTIRRAECLAAILATKDGVVISGTHGKTTTSAMSAHLLRQGIEQPSHYVGAEIPVLGCNAHWDESGTVMVAEGDESDGTLVLYAPEHSIVLNVEEEHLDFYSGIEQIKEVFTTLLDKTSGSIIYCGECPTATELCASRRGAISYGWNDADYVAEEVVEQGGRVSFNVVVQGEFLGRVELGVPGRHNVLNAMAAIALARACGVNMDGITRALATFAGAKRRFETKYVSDQFRIIDDYGHHPTELAATLQTARSLQPKRLLVLFQPHRFSRTQKLAAEFGDALQLADRVFVTDVYAASESPIEGVGGQTIVDAVHAAGATKAEFVGAVPQAHYVVGNALKEGDVLITLGAGNVHEAGTKIARDLTLLESFNLGFSADSLVARLYEPMRKHSTMLVGGPAQIWLEPGTTEVFAHVVSFCRERGIPLRVVGRGSNLLVRDGGIRGVVMHPTRGEFGEVRVEGDVIHAGAGVRFKKLAMAAQKAGLSGFEWMEGIPGNVGGGMRMNAGAMGTETFDQVVTMKLLMEDGEVRELRGDEIESHYRNVPTLRLNYVLSVCFKGVPAPAEEIAEKMEESMQKRRRSQPLAASAGCIFKNPEEMPAGMLVDRLGLKESSIGNAMVSTEHGNFIINTGKATATEVLDLIKTIRKKAHEEMGIQLDTEVQIIGEDEAQF